MSVNEYKLPDVGEGLTEAEIVAWKVKVGDTIKVNDIVVEIETAKSLVELPSPYAGTIMALLVNEGDTVLVGTPMISVASGDSAAAAPTAVAPTAVAPTSEPVEPDGEEPMKTLVGYGPRATDAKRRARKVVATPDGSAAHLQLQGAFTPGGTEPVDVVDGDEPAVPSTPAAHIGDEGSVKVLAKPPVRKLAKDLGIDLRSVTPSGPNGTITRADIEGFTAGAATSVKPTEIAGAPALAGGIARSGERETREPIKGVRKMMGRPWSSRHSAPRM